MAKKKAPYVKPAKMLRKVVFIPNALWDKMEADIKKSTTQGLPLTPPEIVRRALVAYYKKGQVPSA